MGSAFKVINTAVALERNTNYTPIIVCRQYDRKILTQNPEIIVSLLIIIIPRARGAGIRKEFRLNE